ncbi:MAG: LUD domain-containing protein [Desulfobacterales bacterium]|nr:LUD domain-containing protein [Desulfobacterales bacterium]
MSTRDMILKSVKRNQPSAVSLPDVPRFDEGEGPPLPRFKENVERMGGKLAEFKTDTDLNAWVAKNYPEAKVVCSATPEVGGNREITSLTAPQGLEDVDLGIARAVFGVAETGSVYLSNRELKINALGYLSQHLLVLLDPADIVGNLHHAFARPEFAEARYSVLMTGPSATADIEGVLIHGAQGARSLTVALMAKPTGEASA